MTTAVPVVDSEGGNLGQLPPNLLWRPLEWRPFAINAPLFGVHGRRNKFKNTPKWAMLFA